MDDDLSVFPVHEPFLLCSWLETTELALCQVIVILSTLQEYNVKT